MTAVSRRAAWLGALLVTLAPVAIATPAGAAPPYTMEERAVAIAAPSLVYLETVYTGYLRDKKTGVALLASPVTYNRRCSGFVVNPAGFVATTRVCAQPPDETVRQQALYVAGFMLVGEKQLDAGKLDSFVNANMDTAAFTGMADGTPPDVQLFGQQNVATGARTDKPAIPGKVVGACDPDQGNVAIVKLEQGNLPAVQVHPGKPLEPGSSVVTLGFNTTDPDQRVGTYTPQARSVQVVGEGHRGKAPFYKLNDKLGTYAHGGMALDSDGRVVGMVDEDPALPNNENRAVADASSITAFLGRLGVANTLGVNDERYRTGLAAYFKGEYTDAIRQLDATVHNVPSNQVARTYRGLAADRQKIEGEPSGLPGWLVAVVAAGAGVLATALVALAVGRRRARHRDEPDLTASIWAPPTQPPPVGEAVPAPPAVSWYQAQAEPERPEVAEPNSAPAEVSAEEPQPPTEEGPPPPHQRWAIAPEVQSPWETAPEAQSPWATAPHGPPPQWPPDEHVTAEPVPDPRPATTEQATDDGQRPGPDPQLPSPW